MAAAVAVCECLLETFFNQNTSGRRTKKLVIKRVSMLMFVSSPSREASMLFSFRVAFVCAQHTLDTDDSHTDRQREVITSDNSIRSVGDFRISISDVIRGA